MTNIQPFDFNAFQAQYKYRIAGSVDALFSAVGGVIKDETAFSLLKSSRVGLNSTIQNITNTETDPAIRDTRIAKEKIIFAERALAALQKVGFEGKTKASAFAPALGALAGEIQNIVNSYIANTAETSEEQTAFLNRAQDFTDRLARFTRQQSFLLPQENIIFNADIARAKRFAQNTTSAISARLAEISNPAPLDGGDGMDIIA
jgi:hypothetical protein